MKDKLMAVAMVLGVLGSIMYMGFTLAWSVECREAGGAYIVPQNSWPVCVQGVQP